MLLNNQWVIDIKFVKSNNFIYTFQIQRMKIYIYTSDSSKISKICGPSQFCHKTVSTLT
jgi:uncharacterized protein YhbP (UPF0306 family)